MKHKSSKTVKDIITMPTPATVTMECVVVFFDQLSGAARAQKLVKILSVIVFMRICVNIY